MERVADLTEKYLTQDKARAYVQFVKNLAAAGGNLGQARAMFTHANPQSKHIDLIQRASVSAGTTTGWGAELAPLEPLAGAFLDLIRPRTIIGKLAQVRRVPFRVRMPAQVEGVKPGWTAEGRPILVGKGEFETLNLQHSKIGGIVVLTKELVESSDPKAELVMQRDLGAGIIEFSDQQFIDPTVAEIEDTSPASITHGAPEVESTGTTAAQVEDDFGKMAQSLIDAGVNLTDPYWIMSPATALHLTKLRGAGGTRIFPDVGLTGGTILEIPVIVSAGAGTTVVLLDAAEILLADDGLELTTAEHANLQMSDAPVDGEATMVSLWQLNLVAVKAVRFIRWRRRRDEAVVWMTLEVAQ